jgi:hypothetical protein
MSKRGRLFFLYQNQNYLYCLLGALLSVLIFTLFIRGSSAFVMACAVLIVKAFQGIPGLGNGKIDARDSNPGSPAL